MKFYENELPKIDDIVMCHVEKIQDHCIYVKLLEYDNIQGLVQLADASTRRKRKSVCLLKINKKYPLLVIRIDEKNKYIDLSNKFLSEEDKDYAVKNFDSYSFTIKMLKAFLSKKFQNENNSANLELYIKKTLWKVPPKKCYNYIIDNYVKKGNFEDFDMSEEDKEMFKSTLESSLGEVSFKSKLCFNARCTNFEGVSMLRSIFEGIYNKYSLIVMIDVAPNYYLLIESNNENENKNILDEVNLYLENIMSKNDCFFKSIGITTVNNLE